MGRGAIDLWVNVAMGGWKDIEYLQKVKQDYFKGGDDFFRDLSIAECLDAMDSAGVDRSVLTVPAHAPPASVLAFCEQHPDRFSLAVVPDLPEDADERAPRASWAAVGSKGGRRELAAALGLGCGLLLLMMLGVRWWNCATGGLCM